MMGMLRPVKNSPEQIRKMEELVRGLREKAGISPDKYPVDILHFASLLGVKVYDAEFTNPEILGMVITDKSRVPKGIAPGEKGTIFVAKDQYPPRKAFTIAHELGHLFLGHAEASQGLRTDLFRGKGVPYDPEAERQANLFAATLLMPEVPFRQVWEALSHRGVPLVAAFFGVSVNAAMVRARELGLDVDPF